METKELEDDDEDMGPAERYKEMLLEKEQDGDHVRILASFHAHYVTDFLLISFNLGIAHL